MGRIKENFKLDFRYNKISLPVRLRNRKLAIIAVLVSSFVPLVEVKTKIRKFSKRKNILSQDGEILQWTFVWGRSGHLVKRFMSH